MSFVRIGAPRLLMAIVLLGLVLRVFFLFFGAPAFYHSPTGFYFNGDSSSYIQAFENWWRTGNYSFDFQEPDASVGRLPGYPFFYGFIRIIAGINNAPVAVAWLQILLDTGAILLVYGIVRRLAPQRAEGGLIGAFLYATYPFVIIWTPIMGTESLSTDLGLL